MKYRLHSSSISIKFKKQQLNTDREIKQKMLDFLTDDIDLKNEISKLIFEHKENFKTNKKSKNQFLKNIFR